MIFNYFLILITLLLISGLAIDAGLLEWHQIHLQNAADAAAQEAMYQLAKSDASYATEGKAQATQNGFTDGVNGVTVSVTQPPTSTVWVNDQWSVQATVSQSVTNLFMGLVNGGKSTVAATAVARVLPTCVWIMDPSSSANSTFWLASATLSGPCGLYVNTASGPNLGVDGFSTLSNLRTRVVGPASGNSSTGSVWPTPKFNAAAKNDPLAYVSSPSFSSCTHTGGTTISGGSYSFSPGTYCGGITLSNTSVTLSAGLYIITGGLTMTNSYIYGTSGVTLYFTKGGGSNYGEISVTSSGIYLKAPTTTAGGGVPGIVMFGDRSWVAHGSRAAYFAYTDIQFDGIWYLPNIGVSFWESPISYYNYNGLVVDNYYQYGCTTVFHTNYSPLGGFGPLGGQSPYHYEDGDLVE